jgi:hypothetical protein
VEDTSSRLVLRDRTLWISLVCFAAVAALLIRFAAVPDNKLLLSAALSFAFGLPFLRTTDLVFDKALRQCSLRRLDMFRVTRQSLSFRDIRDVQVEVEPQAGDSHVVSCRFSRVTASTVIPLAMAYEPDLERYNKMRETILDTLFAGAPRPQALDPVHALVRQGNIVSAVALLRKREGLDLVTARDRVAEIQNSDMKSSPKNQATP